MTTDSDSAAASVSVVRRASSAVTLVGSIVLAVYISVINTGYWLWVATSAYLGIRDSRSVGFGLLATVLALGPLAAGTAAGWRIRRSKRSKVRAWRVGAIVAFLASLPALVFAAAITVI